MSTARAVHSQASVWPRSTVRHTVTPTKGHVLSSAHRIAVSLCLAALATGCGGGGGSTVDAATDPGLDGGDGGSVCCPRDLSPCSNARLGGRAASLDECPGPSGIYDGWWSSGTSDGCPVWVNHGITPAEGAMCCGCAPDAGIDASTDAGTEGVCCPRDLSPCSNARVGGWAPTLDECPGPNGIYDGVWTDEADAHGCALWVNHGISFVEGAICCGCPHDAGPPS